MTPAALLIQLAGLSHREAADFLRIRLDTVKSWHRAHGANGTSDGILSELRALIAQQERTAAQAIAQMAQMADIARENGEDAEGVLGYPADDYEARSLGWPCVGAWRAMAARVIAAAPVRIILVPRGSTPETAAAADAHRK